MEINISYFPPKDTDKNLGGGYVTSGVLKTRFTVLKSAKTESGIFVALPSRKKDDGTYENFVEVPSSEARHNLDQAVLQKMANADVSVTGATTTSAPRNDTAPQETVAPKRVVKAAGANIPKVPF